jgi:cellulose synthase/poly-beta-1,6-N-acetylglucosamine synthase-like glycosyltransferase
MQKQVIAEAPSGTHIEATQLAPVYDALRALAGCNTPEPCPEDRRILAQPDLPEEHSPELTVVVACFNVAEFVAACLRSIFHQPQVDRLRILVIDDGSVDETSTVVLAEIAAHQEVSCELVTQTNQGLSCARNTGLRLARTSYVTFADNNSMKAAAVALPLTRRSCPAAP